MDKARPTSDHEAWLGRTQDLLHDIRWWVRNGRSETTVARIDEYWAEWRKACEGSARNT